MSLSNALLLGAISGYLIGILSNFILESIFVEYHLANFLNGVQERPIQLLIVFFAYPLFLASWFIGIGLAASVWFYRKHGQ